ncbi:uncharacterized protein LOC115632968 [Scaptodrosophila lebanonensis]|uniref:Uncharacterized protein LOC115632968 n=1 Tax=Drosophila lebanonensis TaxID=7225 RepID=A0A6J2UFE2_DROLE|nr:uncharacterized protein LOC115632968 [Scaptodrosophila lebanonensis]
MSPRTRRYIVAILFLLSFFVYRMAENQFGAEKPLFPRCQRFEEHALLKDFTHTAESCTMEKYHKPGAKPNPLYVKVSCRVEELPRGYTRRLKPEEHVRNLLEGERSTETRKHQWTFEVPRDAIQGLNELAL